MEHQEINELLERYLEGSCTSEEALLVNSYFNKVAQEQSETHSLTDLDERKVRVWNSINSKFLVTKKISLWPRFIGVAVAVATIVFGVWFFNGRDEMEDERTVVFTKDIGPGRNAATVQFANGETIILDETRNAVLIQDGQIKYSDGSTPNLISNLNTEGPVTISTPRGGTYKVTLYDGSTVQLNAASKLTYLPEFNRGKVRKVQLEGEGYFEIAKDASRPFTVESAGQRVEVLGTHFNINCYPDEDSVCTTLLEGSVRIDNFIMLKPHQQAVKTAGSVVIKPANPGVTAWTKDKFSFYETSLKDVLKQLSRWYDVDIVYSGAIPDRKYTGDLNRNLNASEALRLFKFSGVSFQIEGRKIIVMNN